MALMHYPLDEYLILDEMRSEFRLQYVEGDVFAMSGSSLDKSRMTNSLLDLLRALPREYHVCLSRLRLATPSGLYSYADIMVVHGKLDMVPGIRDTVTNPVLLVEIPSNWTDEFDRGKKFEHYSSIPSLRDCLLIDQYTIGVEHRWREGDVWRSTHHGKGETFTLTGIPLTIKVDALYEDVTIPA
jgi:Uma2 family endonuclease